MALEVNGFNPLINNQLNTDNRLNNQQQRQLQQERNNQQARQAEDTQPTQDDRDIQSRRAEAVQQLEEQQNRIRRDDDSDLSFQARQALNRFNEVSQQDQNVNASEVLGIDIFA